MSGSRRALRWRWSWRDLRQRWVLVVTIALILAIGTGIYAALQGTTAWRLASNDASFEATKVHDLRVELTRGDTVAAGTLLAAVTDDGVAVAEERLVWPTQVEVPDAEGGTALVRAKVVGVPTGSQVDVAWTTAGEQIPGAVVVEDGFARARDLDAQGTLVLAGARSVPWSGLALMPEHFLGGGDEVGGVGFLDRGGFAVLNGELALVQQLLDRPGQVNEVVVRLAPGSDREAAAAALESRLAEVLPDVGTTVTTTDDLRSYRTLYEDAGNDGEVWRFVALLILGGASFAAFNLINRIVEAQRREIGIGMALGVDRQELAVRPMLVGLQVALLGVVLGIGVGLLVNGAMKSMFESVLPLPIWRTPFQWGMYAQAAAVGLLLPLAATVVPVWRAVRVQPIEAIRTGHFATGRSGWARLGTHLRRPARSTRQYPIRNLLRSPRRALLTALAIAASITVLVAIVGMLDSFLRTIDRADVELTGAAPERLDVSLDGFVALTDPVVAAVAGADGVGEVAPVLSLGGRLSTDDGDELVAVALTALAFDTAPWSPAVARGDAPSPETGVLLADKAADDLGLRPGDTVRLQHPERVGTGYRLVTTEVPVAGTHDIPWRSLAYLDLAQAGLFGLDGIVNGFQVTPAPGYTTDDVQRSLFGVPGVAAATSLSSLSDTLRDGLSAYTGILRIMEGFVLLLALLIAFNAMSTAVDERRREHATMFAFGVPVRSVLGMTVFEAAVIGLVATVAGVVFGWLAIQWIFGSMLPETLPEVGLTVYVSWGTVGAAVVLGVVAVAIAPLFTVRRLHRMDIPSTLRVVE
jgi:putative ABC transport system permease protein